MLGIVADSGGVFSVGQETSEHGIPIKGTSDASAYRAVSMRFGNNESKKDSYLESLIFSILLNIKLLSVLTKVYLK